MTGVTQSSRATPPLLKHLNERTILEAIRAAAPISRAEISRRAGISKPTVSLALQSLLRAGLVREAQRGPDGPSYGAVFFEPVPEAAYVLGLDLGARFLRGAVCDLAGEIRARQDVELRGADADGALDAIAKLQASLVASALLFY
jgi:DNA-binding transcriptional ArsR family regulator